MNSERYKQFLLSVIRGAKPASGGREINCRCFECPDSADPSHGHMYISIPQSSDEPSLFYCHKCPARGVVTHKKLIEWNIYNQDIAEELIFHNKNCSGKSSNGKYYNRAIYNIYNTRVTDDEVTRYKIDYINNRLGLNLSVNDIRNLKIVLNLKDLLASNWIQKYTRDIRIVEELNTYFLGFLSIDNAFCNMRKLCKDGVVNKSIDKRYINYKIADKFDTSERFYTVPSKIDLNTPNPIKLHIAEGPFDILSVYKNVRNEEPGIYTSIAGSNYIGQIMFFLEAYRLPYIEIHIYPDNDKFGSNERMQHINDALYMFNFPFYVHRNMMPGEKDFGVSKDKIKENIMCLRN